jgi:hypothetical protein
MGPAQVRLGCDLDLDLDLHLHPAQDLVLDALQICNMGPAQVRLEPAGGSCA